MIEVAELILGVPIKSVRGGCMHNEETGCSVLLGL
jgi:hypothetical protein